MHAVHVFGPILIGSYIFIKAYGFPILITMCFMYAISYSDGINNFITQFCDENDLFYRGVELEFEESDGSKNDSDYSEDSDYEDTESDYDDSEDSESEDSESDYDDSEDSESEDPDSEEDDIVESVFIDHLDENKIIALMDSELFSSEMPLIRIKKRINDDPNKYEIEMVQLPDKKYNLRSNPSDLDNTNTVYYGFVKNCEPWWSRKDLYLDLSESAICEKDTGLKVQSFHYIQRD